MLHRIRDDNLDKGHTMPTIDIKPGDISYADLKLAYDGPFRMAFHPDVYDKIDAAADFIARTMAEGKTVYGVNTGFGLLASERIESDDLHRLQRNLVLSHAVGTGPALDDETVRLILFMKAASLAQGYSGVRRDVVDMLVRMLEANLLPVVPSQGSVGASGDLAPLAHVAATMIGVGEATLDGERMSADDALAKVGLDPLFLQPKEGLALLNGTQVSTAIAIRNLFVLNRLFYASVLTGSLSADAVRGSDTPFHPMIHKIRGQEGQITVAELYRAVLKGSAIRASHEDCDRVQDPYSIRCQPQVLGAVLDSIEHSAEILANEANAVSDNPLVFPETEEILSGGNFHAEPVALAADHLGIAASEIGALSERRIALLIDANLSGLPPFLAKDGGLNSGFMIAHVTAAALASENKTYAHPASVDSLPTSANQEDHVSMATFAARKLEMICGNLASILAIEYLAAAQGVHLLRPLRSSKTLEEFIETLREDVPAFDEDRFFAPDLEIAKAIILSPRIDELIGGVV